ncbi:MAG: multidrug efflux transporter, partial [Myxococcaceae bacterium]|nr:multidrug efflux transporter [Myxococcaceae bacterium]
AGMLPLLFSRGIGAGLNRNIAGVIVGGQVLSLALTLLATPVICSLFDDAVVRWNRRKGGAPTIPPIVEPPTVATQEPIPAEGE